MKSLSETLWGNVLTQCSWRKRFQCLTWCLTWAAVFCSTSLMFGALLTEVPLPHPPSLTSFPGQVTLLCIWVLEKCNNNDSCFSDLSSFVFLIFHLLLDLMVLYAMKIKKVVWVIEREVQSYHWPVADNQQDSTCAGWYWSGQDYSCQCKLHMLTVLLWIQSQNKISCWAFCNLCEYISAYA